MRDLNEVINDMLKVIPSEEEGLISDLEKIKESYSYAAPESVRLWWGETVDALESEIGEPTEDWHKEVQRIFVGQ